MFAETNLILSFRVYSSAVLESKTRKRMLHGRSLSLRHNSEAYERNLRVLEAVEKPLEVKKKNTIMLRDFIFGLKKQHSKSS